MKSVPIYVWTEPVDNLMVAVHARARTIHRGGIWGMSIFVLMLAAEARAYDQKSYERVGHVAAKNRLRAELARNHGGHLPFICRVDQSEQVGIA